MIFSGASGGPTFLAGPFLPKYAHKYRGGAGLFCGGLVNTNAAFRGDSDFIKSFDIYIVNGTKDFLLPGARAAMAYYKKKGMRVKGDFLPGVEHCGFSATMHQMLDARVRKIMGRRNKEEEELISRHPTIDDSVVHQADSL